MGEQEASACSYSPRRVAQLETEVVACGSPGQATDEGADSGRLSGAWGDVRRAAELIRG